MPYVRKSPYTRKPKKKIPLRKKTATALSKDVRMLKQLAKINRPEKKHLEEFTSTQRSVGQFNNTGTGQDSYEVSPAIPVGTGSSSRIGKTVNLTSLSLRFQFYQQVNTSGARKVEIYLIQNVGDSAFQLTEFLRPNQFFKNQNSSIEIYDTNCSREQGHYKNFRVLAHRKVHIPQDSDASQKTVKNYSLGLKFKRPMPLMYDATSGAMYFNRLQLLVLTDAGNKGGTDQVFTGVVTNTNNTGVAYNLNMDWYYTDA